MKLPRLSIAWVMGIVVIASINCAAIRVLERPTTAFVQLLVIGLMPMASILMMGIPTLVWGLLGRSKTRPFLVGFEGFGWTILLLGTGMAFFFPSLVGEAVAKGWRVLGFAESRDSFWQSLIFFDMILYFLPQFLIALAGGWLVGMFKIRVTIERRSTSRSETLTPPTVGVDTSRQQDILELTLVICCIATTLGLDGERPMSTLDGSRQIASVMVDVRMGSR